ncbi:hypothetical protein CCACVL1_06174 [Corchorus capsularis]|uniref:Uncharacterized protein n=1 Tax=Corchorus capsularis TaxID=210143 RepID=A0A1R3JH01_COCAP|nr:hypothetical protein CCACVL1_06174 [Corchorus capsularis]
MGGASSLAWRRCGWILSTRADRPIIPYTQHMHIGFVTRQH